MISVIIPFFNSQETLRKAINSVVLQSLSDWELILVNDGSQDDSEMVAKSFLDDNRISYISQSNKGVSSARNLGSSMAKGEWLIFLDSDDQLASNSLSFFSKNIQSNPKTDLFSAGHKRISHEKTVIVIPQSGKYFSRLSGTFVIRKDVFLKIGGYDEHLSFAENTELFHRFNLFDGIEQLIPSVSLLYFEHQSGGSKNLQNMIDSLTYFLIKHSSTLSNHVKFLYHQIIGVNYMRFQNYPSARIHLWKAYRLKPFEFGTFIRLVIAFIPTLAKRLYLKEVRY